MIVMKFGGSSVASGEAIGRVTQIVKSQLSRNPVVVVSAMGKTTNRLLELADEAGRGHIYFVWKRLKELQEFHLEEAAKVIRGDAFDSLEQSVRKQFTQLCRIILEATDEGREITAALRDEIASLGERVSSEIVAAALNSAGISALHLDSRKVILTDDKHTHATPLYWETYAKLRRVVPFRDEHHTLVMGGFIGATATGETTTLGRGGSDLTASIVGAGISAEEVQIWTDVDGMLSCDPRVFDGGYRLKCLSYGEATAMARGGAKVLHPDTVLPAVRQRIPVVIRNTRRPQCEGTRITSSAGFCTNPVKSIAAKPDVTVLELRRPGGVAGFVESLTQLCDRHGVAAELIAQAGDAVYLAVKSSDRFDHLQMDLDHSVEARVRTGQCLITLVGAGAHTPAVAARALATLDNPEALVVSYDHAPLAMTIVVPRQELRKSVAILHQEFFKQVDSRVFAENVRFEMESLEEARQVEGQRARRPVLRWVLAKQH